MIILILKLKLIRGNLHENSVMIMKYCRCIIAGVTTVFRISA